MLRGPVRRDEAAALVTAQQVGAKHGSEEGGRRAKVALLGRHKVFRSNLHMWRQNVESWWAVFSVPETRRLVKKRETKKEAKQTKARGIG